MARDDQFQLGGVQHVQQWTQHRPLRHAEQYALYRRQATTVRDLLCAISQERAYPLERSAWIAADDWAILETMTTSTLYM